MGKEWTHAVTQVLTGIAFLMAFWLLLKSKTPPGSPPSYSMANLFETVSEIDPNNEYIIKAKKQVVTDIYRALQDKHLRATKTMPKREEMGEKTYEWVNNNIHYGLDGVWPFVEKYYDRNYDIPR